MPIDTTRHITLFDPNQFGNKPVHIIGCGATGSKVILELAKLGVPNIHAWDFDKIESHNIANQAFKITQIGQYKADAIKALCKEFADSDITAHQEKVEAGKRLSGVVFVLTDTMKSRKEIWDGCLKSKLSVDAVIETRMGVNSLRVYTVKPADPVHIKAYEDTLYADEQSVESVCGSKITVGATANITASFAVWQFLKIAANKDCENEVIVATEPAVIMSQTYGLK